MKPLTFVIRWSTAFLLAYFGLSMVIEVVRDREADFLEALNFTGLTSAVIGAVAGAAAIYCVYLLINVPSKLLHVVQISLAFVLLFAGLVKLIEPGGARSAIVAYRLNLPNGLVGFMAFGLPAFEVMLGLLLLVGIWVRFAAVGSSVLMLVFIVAIAQVWARGYSIDCGCFGSGGNLDPDGRHLRYALEILRDLVFIGQGVVMMRAKQAAFSLLPTTTKE